MKLENKYIGNKINFGSKKLCYQVGGSKNIFHNHGGDYSQILVQTYTHQVLLFIENHCLRYTFHQ
jgi:hypothetical protein